MCGRFANAETIPVIAARWSAAVADGAQAWEPEADIRPTQRVPVLLDGPAERPRRLGLMTWGWVRDFATGGRLINARAEGIATKRTFAEAVQHRRCLVPATAWFEWQKVGSSPTPNVKQVLRPERQETWAIAGVWERTSEGGAVVLLTTVAHPSVAKVHDRMPVVIHRDHGGVWLAGDLGSALGLCLPTLAEANPAEMSGGGQAVRRGCPPHDGVGFTDRWRG
jgi:putative SOS response-associated peptidase YedK